MDQQILEINQLADALAEAANQADELCNALANVLALQDEIASNSKAKGETSERARR